MREERKKTNWFTHLITFFLGVFTLYIAQQINTYLSRPIFNVEPKSIVIYENHKAEWIICPTIRLTNFGKSPGLIRLNSISVLLSQISQRPFQFNLDTLISLENNFSIERKFEINFPPILKNQSFQNIPQITQIEINVEELTNSSQSIWTKDSSTIFTQMVWEKAEGSIQELNGIQYDSLKKDFKLLTKPAYIEYKGRNYLNHAFPRDVQLEYRVKNDKIELQYSLPLNLFSKNQKINTHDDFIFFPHPDIKDKIVYPENLRLKLNLERRGKESIEYDEYTIEVKSKLRNYLYIIK